MAGRPTKKNAENIQKNNVKIIDKTANELKLENEVLELKKMVENLIKNQQLEKKEQIVQGNTMPNTSMHYHYDDKYKNVPFGKFIEVMSLTNNKLTLSTERHGKGNLYNFVEFGEVQNILYDDLNKIILNNSTFTKNGAYCILNSQVIEIHGLKSYYDKFLDKDTILNILSLDSDNIINLFKNTTKQIQDTVVSIMIERIKNDEFVDLNKLKYISDIYGEDIYTLARNIKQNN